MQQKIQLEVSIIEFSVCVDNVAVLPGSGQQGIVIRNGLPDPDIDADRHQNVISWSLGHTPALRKISSKSVGNSIIQ